MNKILFPIIGMTLLLLLHGTSESYAVSDKKTKKLAQKAEEAITEAQASLIQWQTADLIAPPKAKEILEKAQEVVKTILDKIPQK